MKPLPGENVTYIDENGQKFVAKVTESFVDESKKHGLVTIEYIREDRSTGRVSAVCHIEDQYETATGKKHVCYTSEKQKSDKHKNKVATSTTATGPTTTDSTTEIIPGPISDSEEPITA